MLATLRTIALVLFTGLFTPRRCAQRTADASTATVWAAHLLGLGLATAVLLGGVCLAEWLVWNSRHPLTRPATFHSRLEEYHMAIVVGLGIAMTYFAALIATPLAWRDEPWRDTWRHALRRVRLFAPAWMLPAALSCVTVFAFILIANGPPPGAVHFALLGGWTVLPVWCYTIIGSAASAPRLTPDQPVEPVCENCGYLLHHVPASRRCPECGADIDSALDPAYRCLPGSRPAPLSGVPAVVRFPALAAWLRPRDFYGRVRLNAAAWPLVLRPAGAHLLAGGITLSTFLVGLVWVGEESPPVRAIAVGCLLAPAVATLLFGVWSAGVGLIGLIASAATQRNLLRAALIVAAYASAFPVVWAFVAASTLVGLIGWAQYARLRSPVLPLTILLVENVLLGSWYVLGVWRRMRYVRYGNWRFSTAEGDPNLPRSSRPHP